MRRKWMIREDQEGVSPVIATILMVAITVVLAAVLYAMVMSIPPGQDETNMLGINRIDTGNNVTLSIARVSGDLPLTQVTLTIKDSNGFVKNQMSAVPFSELTADKWDVHKVLYQKVKPGEMNVKAGASLLIDKATYESGYRYEILDRSTIIASGTL